MTRGTVLQSLTFAPLLLAACGAPTPPAEPPHVVLVHTVAYGAAGASAVYPGEIRARHETDLAFRIGGKLLCAVVDAGAEVRRGQVLARLDPQDVKLASDAAQAQLGAAETELRFAQAELKRSESLARPALHQPDRLRRQTQPLSTPPARGSTRRGRSARWLRTRRPTRNLPPIAMA